VTEGEYLRPGDEDGILIGRALADEFETGLGKKLVLMSQDTHREIASRAYRITGIFRSELEATEKEFVFVSLPGAGRMLALSNAFSEVAILFASPEESEAVVEKLKSALTGRELEVST